MLQYQKIVKSLKLIEFEECSFCNKASHSIAVLNHCSIYVYCILLLVEYTKYLIHISYILLLTEYVSTKLLPNLYRPHHQTNTKG